VVYSKGAGKDIVYIIKGKGKDKVKFCVINVVRI
jgi:hypothetical protein